MAFKGIRFSLGVILFSIVNAKTEDFPKLDCKAENLGQYGQQSLLQCVIKYVKSDTVIQIVSWKKASRALLVFREEAITKQEQGFSFAQPSWNARNMNVTLLLTNTSVEHQGEYTCYVLTDHGSSFEKTNLKVTARYSKPKITFSQNNTGGTLTCESDGGYPEGQLRWYDKHNVELTSDAQTETTASGLFQLSSKLIVEKKSPDSKYTCRVFNASRGQEEETLFQEIYKQERKGGEPRKELDMATKIVAPVVVIGTLIAGLLFALLFYKRRFHQIRRPSSTPLMGGLVAVRTSNEGRVEEGDDEYPDNVA